jgi:hypothetical protein
VHRGQIGIPPEHVGVAVLIALAGCKRRTARGADGVVERKILSLLRPFRELDVVDDLPGALRVQTPDHAAVQGAGERPRAELSDRRVVDLHDHDPRGLWLVSQPEAGGDRRSFERVEGASQVGEARECSCGGEGHDERDDAGAPQSPRRGLGARDLRLPRWRGGHRTRAR